MSRELNCLRRSLKLCLAKGYAPTQLIQYSKLWIEEEQENGNAKHKNNFGK